MSSPDERQGDINARCSRYSCSAGPEHSVACDKIDRPETEVDVVTPLSNYPAQGPHEGGGTDSNVPPSRPREQNNPNNLRGISTDGALTRGNNDNTAAPA